MVCREKTVRKKPASLLTAMPAQGLDMYVKREAWQARQDLVSMRV